jgi:HSP20 family protein
MDRVFDDPFFHTVPLARATRRMPLDVIDTQGALVLEAALPGVRPEDIDISVLEDVLTVTAGTDAQEQSTESGGYQVREVRRGRISRSVTLPHGLRTDEASASFENGLLRLSIPKAQAAERRQIPITAPTAPVQVVEAVTATSNASGSATPDATESTTGAVDAGATSD